MATSHPWNERPAAVPERRASCAWKPGGVSVWRASTRLPAPLPQTSPLILQAGLRAIGSGYPLADDVCRSTRAKEGAMSGNRQFQLDPDELAGHVRLPPAASDPPTVRLCRIIRLSCRRQV
jgi:hypothetical protein